MITRRRSNAQCETAHRRVRDDRGGVLLSGKLCGDLDDTESTMAVNPILQSGLNGIQNGLKGMNRAAQDIADLNLDDRSKSPSDNDVIRRNTPTDRLTDAAEAIVGLEVHERQVQASAKVVETADEILGFLLDVRA